MSKNSDTDVFLKTSFLYGGNATYLEDLQSKFEQDPASVDSAWRSFFAGLKIASAYAITGAVIGEWISASSGLGVVITRSQAAFRLDRIFVAVVFVAILSIALFTIVQVIARLATPWMYVHHQEES